MKFNREKLQKLLISAYQAGYTSGYYQSMEDQDDLKLNLDADVEEWIEFLKVSGHIGKEDLEGIF